MSSGNRSFRFSEAHGKSEITAMAFDCDYRRLITGARGNDIYKQIYNFDLHFFKKKMALLTCGIFITDKLFVNLLKRIRQKSQQ